MGTYGNKMLTQIDLDAITNRPYTHIQSVAACTWVVNHRLGRYPPSVGVRDSSMSNEMVYGTITHIDVNTLHIDFAAQFAGEAYIL